MLTAGSNRELATNIIRSSGDRLLEETLSDVRFLVAALDDFRHWLIREAT
jgi:hypothetical protein